MKKLLYGILLMLPVAGLLTRLGDGGAGGIAVSVLSTGIAAWFAWDNLCLYRKLKRKEKSECAYEQFVETMPLYVYVEDVNDNFRHVKCNRVCSELWGRPVNEILGKSDEDLFDDPEEIRMFRETAWRAVESEGWHEDILPFTGADGQRRIGRFFRRCFKLSGGRLWLFCVVADITNEFNHRARLDAAFQTFEFTFDLTRSAIFRLDIQNRLITGAKNIGEIWPVVDGRALKSEEVVHRDDHEKFIAAHSELLSGKVEKIQLDYSSEYFGELRYYRMEAGLDRVTDGKTMMIGIIQDVTEEKKRKKQNREAEMLLNTIANSIPVVLFVKNASDEFRYIMANNAFGKLFGTSPEQIVGKNDAAFFRNNQPEIFRRNDEAVCSSVEGRQELIETVVGMDGKTHVFKVEKKCFPGINGERFLLGVGSDITEQTELIENQRALNDCFERILSRSFIENPALPVMETLCRRLNASRCYLLRHDEAAGKVFPEFEYRQKTDGLALQKLGEYKLDTAHTWFKIIEAGELFGASDMTSPEAVAFSGMWSEAHRRFGVKSLYAFRVVVGGELWGNFGVSYEDEPHVLSEHEKDFLVSGAHLLGLMIERRQEHRRVLDVLREQEISMKQMEFSAVLTQSAYFRTDDSGRIFTKSSNFNELVPMRGDFAFKPEEWVLPEDLPLFPAEVSNLGREPATTHFRSDHFGERRYYRLRIARASEDGSEWFGVIQNITEITEKAVKLKETQELWEQVINSIPTFFFAKDADHDFRYVLCNRAFAAFVGKKPEELIGKTDRELFPLTEEADRYRKKDLEIMTSSAGESFEEESTDASGVIHYIRSTKVPFTSVNGQRLLLATNTDVTELHNLLRFEQINSKVLAGVVGEADFLRATDVILNTMLSVLNCEHVVLSRRHPDGEQELFHDAFSERFAAVRQKDNHLLLTFLNLHPELFDKNGIFFFDDFQVSPEVREFLRIHPETPVSSFACAPIFVEEKLFGILTVSFVSRHSFGKSDEILMRAMSNIIAIAQIREQQNQVVKQTEIQNQTIIDNISIPIALYNEHGEVIRVNNCALELFKTETVEKYPYSCRDLTECGVAEAECPVARAFASGREQQHFDHRCNRDFIIHASPIKNKAGKVVSVLKSGFDVTRLNRLNRNREIINRCLSNLLRETDMHRAIKISIREITENVKANRCYIFRFDTDNKTISSFIEFAASGNESLLGQYQNHPWSAEPDWESRFARSRFLSFPELQNDIEKEGLKGWKDFILQYDVRSLYACRIDLNGSFWGYIGVIYEGKTHLLDPEEEEFISSIAHCVELMLIRRKYQTELLSAVEKAKAADRAKSMFLASMSHEIRTPLNAVIGFSELLKDNNLPPEEQRDYLAGIASSGNALLALINDVLDLSKLEAGQMKFSPVEVDVAELLEEIGGIFKQRCRSKGLDFRIDIPAELPHLMLDKLRLRQILFNLIGNALKFTAAGSVTVGVRFEPDGGKESGRLIIAVADTGIGIAKEDQTRIFQMFVQAVGNRQQALSSGSGLGLALVSRLVEHLHGSISLKSEVNQGSEFTVELNEVPVAPGYSAAAAGAATDEDRSKNRLYRSVLLVDDVPMNLKVMAAMLRKLKVETVLANNAEEALAALEKTRFDMILTDLWMPGMNGAELTWKIRSSKRFPAMKIVAVTADVESRLSFDISLFDNVLEKPVSLEKLEKLFKGMRGS